LVILFLLFVHFAKTLLNAFEQVLIDLIQILNIIWIKVLIDDTLLEVYSIFNYDVLDVFLRA